MSTSQGFPKLAPYPVKQYGRNFRPGSLSFADDKHITHESPSITKRKEHPTTKPSPAKRLTTPRSGPSLSSNSASVDSLKLRNDRLGTLVRQLTSAFRASPSWETFVQEFRGRSYLASELDHIDHPAAELLRKWRDEGVPAETDSPPWTYDQKDHCIK